MTRSDLPLRLAAALWIVLVAAAALAPAPARAQARLGDFVPFEAWWVHPTAQTLGIFYDGSVIRIDRDGNNTTESTFLRPTGQTGIPDAAITSLRLTPTRTIVYAFGGTCNTNGTLVYFYRVPASIAENRLEPIRTGLCIPHGILQLGFYDTGMCVFNGVGLNCNGRLGVSPRRVAMFVTTADEFGFTNLVWVDLSTGVVSGPNFDFSNGLGFIEVSPSGTQAFLQHDLPNPDETDYRLIDLCPGPNFGVVINPGGFPIVDVNEQLHAEVLSASGGEVIVIAKNPLDVERDRATFDDCLDQGGACCNEGGSCGVVTEPSCFEGNFLGAGTECSACPEPPEVSPCCFPEGAPICSLLEESTCSAQGGAPQPNANFCSFDLCPTPQPTLALAGPESIQAGDTASYLLTYENEGGVVARDVEIAIQLPSGTTFVSATGNGGVEFGSVRWTLGDLAPGASGSVGFSLAIGCDAEELFLRANISHEPPVSSRTFALSNDIYVTIAPLPEVPLGVSVATLPDAEPLRPGDELVHTITIVNASATAAPNVRLGPAGQTPTGVAFGAGTSFDRTNDAGGGVVNTANNRFGWTGDVGAGQTVSIQYVAQVDSCVQPGNRTTQLGFGTPVAVFDACETEVGTSAVPTSFALEPNARLELEATNLTPAQRLDAPVIDSLVQLTRPNGSAQIELTLQSNAGQALPDASIDLSLRGLTVTTPPTGAGVVYHANDQTIAWSGSIPAGAPVTISFAGNVTACRAEIDLTGRTSASCSDLRERLIVAAVPQPPAGPWLSAIGTQPHPFHTNSSETQIVRVDPGPPSTFETMLCLPTEYFTGMDAAPDGSIWSTWLPTYRVNPATLGFESLDLDTLEAAGLDSLQDVAIDPVDGAVYFSGSRVEAAQFIAMIARRDPVTHDITSYYENASFRDFGQMVVDEFGGVVVVATDDGPDAIVRIDPGTPPTAEIYDVPGQPIDIALDSDGSYVVIDSAGAPAQLRDLDPDTAEVTSIVANLGAAFPGTFSWRAIEVDANGRIYVAPSQSGFGAVRQTPVVTTEVLRPFSFEQTGQVFEMAMVSQPIPEPDAAALALVAIATLILRSSRLR